MCWRDGQELRWPGDKMACQLCVIKSQEMPQSGSKANGICCTVSVDSWIQPSNQTLELWRNIKQKNKTKKSAKREHINTTRTSWWAAFPNLFKTWNCYFASQHNESLPCEPSIAWSPMTDICKHDHKHMRFVKPRTNPLLPWLTYPKLAIILQQQPTQQGFLIIFVWFKLYTTYAESFSPEQDWKRNIPNAMV